MQNPIYVAIGGAKNNRTVEEARAAERKLALIGMPSLGIVAEGNGGQRVELQDFEANSINPLEPANLNIRTSFGNGPDKDSEGNEIENSIADNGSFVSVDAVLDLMKASPDVVTAISRLLSQMQPGISYPQVNARLESLPGVADAKRKAILKAWDAA
jgi:hypothetical protein